MTDGGAIVHKRNVSLKNGARRWRHIVGDFGTDPSSRVSQHVSCTPEASRELHMPHRYKGWISDGPAHTRLGPVWDLNIGASTGAPSAIPPRPLPLVQ